MKLRFSLLLAILTLSASGALASDFGVHGGYYGNDLKEAFVGADLRFPLGPISIMPNLDYSRAHDVNWWFASGDVTLGYATSGGGPSYWFGGGPTYGYVNSGGAHDSEWGWDATAGLGWGAAGFRPYVTGRYIKIRDFKTLGGAIGLRF
jgi:hypothetical protein